jgi:hypothetical protein
MRLEHGGAGWKVVPFVEGTPLRKLDRCAIEEYPTANGAFPRTGGGRASCRFRRRSWAHPRSYGDRKQALTWFSQSFQVPSSV